MWAALIEYVVKINSDFENKFFTYHLKSFHFQAVLQIFIGWEILGSGGWIIILSAKVGDTGHSLLCFPVWDTRQGCATPLWLGVLLTALKSEVVNSGKDMKHNRPTYGHEAWVRNKHYYYGFSMRFSGLCTTLPTLGQFWLWVYRNVR